MSTELVMHQAVSIGEAAALYGLAPSTVRWWEGQGVLNSPARNGGKRLYRDADLRRVGLAYLCCVVGQLPLAQAAVVTSGNATHSAWQRTIDEQITLLGQRIGQLEAARDYLAHLLRCEDDDIACCPILEAELSAHTPRGRFFGTDLVAAARAARSGGKQREKTPTRDESVAHSPLCDENAVLCLSCREPVPRAARGRPRKYCSRACQQRAYRARRGERS
ncbi:helix-turn-helix domain-containing protein [Streptomyces zagrosensis]|uniref:DNA-binding transcriptional MerR regulator n=1 Tax=Streptomyces zagrosensis TaxID=1042984 RepID=A0A7W9QEC9_9ACTN|nr:MerR family transcriptional regulator [Streptomyces zagrosensis]MBB5938479.1 DNA-binding transcriptional MerR regulator [Streptomyces zagrosensis]